MSIPEAVIDAAPTFAEMTGRYLSNETRARRVILALAEELPESAVDKAREAFNAENYVPLKLRAAIIAALKDVGGATP